MADSGNEETFHSAGEEEAIPPLQKSEEKSSKSGQSLSSSTTKKDVQGAGKLNSKKAKNKKGKKKAASNDKGNDSEEVKEATVSTKDDSVSLEESSEAHQPDAKQQPNSESQPEYLSSQDADAETAKCVKSELETDQHEQTSTAEDTPQEASKNENLKDDSSQTRNDSQPDVEPSEESADAKTESLVSPEEEQTQRVKEADEELLETGNEINRDSQEESLISLDENKLKMDERMGESASSSVSSEQAEAADEGRSIAGALGKLTGEKPAEKKASGGGWGWGGWGASLVSSVSAVGHGLSSVIENVETSLGLPKPEELTEQEKRQQEFIVTRNEQGEGKEGREEDRDKDEEGRDPGEGEEMERDGDKEGEEEGDKEQDKSTPDDPSTVPSGMKGFLSLGASAITSVVGKTVTGGLDALETIGRKTMDVLQEGEHRREARSSGQKGNLSEMLRDAKDEAETAAMLEEEEKERQRAHFGILFDQYQGLAHLEALEMISNQGESKVQGSLSALSGEDLQSLKTELIEIRDAFQLEDLESEEQPEGSELDFVNEITEHLFGVSVGSTPDKLQKVQRSVHEWLAECRSQQDAGQKRDIKELHIKAIETLAEFSSRVIEQFHKASELMLLPQDREHTKNAVQRATSLSKLTSVLATEVSNQASKFAECLNREASNQEEGAEPADVNPFITNIYLEASNSTSYIQDAFQLVLPVLQMVAIERRRDATSEAS